MQVTSKAAEYFGSHGQLQDEFESLSIAGGPLEIDAGDDRPISKEAPN